MGHIPVYIILGTNLAIWRSADSETSTVFGAIWQCLAHTLCPARCAFMKRAMSPFRGVILMKKVYVTVTDELFHLLTRCWKDEKGYRKRVIQEKKP